MKREDYTLPFAEPVEVCPETSVAATVDPAFEGGPTFDGMNKTEEDWS